uniref:Uncharacterized protein n=1 Tax=candidate division WOR-3 bacterium TaxID=2052148 RepID=A0A7C4YHW3_UNCW3
MRINKFLILVMVLSLFMFGEDFTPTIPEITEKEVLSVIPILKLEIELNNKYKEQSKSQYNTKKKLFEDIKSGKLDPLDLLKKFSKYVIIPEGVTYEPALSRALSIRGWDLTQDIEIPEEYRIYVNPIAVFTFGKEFPAINKKILGKNITNESFTEFFYNPWNGNDPSFKEMQELVRKTELFYSEKGFSVDRSMDGFSVFFKPRDINGDCIEDDIVGCVEPILKEIYDPAYKDVLKNALSHPMGPSITIEASDKLLEKIINPVDVVMGTENIKVKQLLKDAGLTEERYGEILGALLIAKDSSQNIEEEIPTLEFTPTTPEEKKAFEEYEKYVQMKKEEARVRKNNEKIYLKYKNELDPILEKIQRYYFKKNM